MKKNLFVPLILFLFSIAAFSIPVFAQSIEDILENMIESQGGRTALQEIKDTTLIGFMEIVQMGLGGSLTTYQKEPDRLRMDAKVQGTWITQAYDGEIAWMTNPITGAEEEMPEPMAKDFARSALGNDALLHPEKYGISYTLEGKDVLEGKEYYFITQNFSDGFKAILAVDAETFLIYKTTTTAVNDAGGESFVETVFSDYKKAGPVTLAHSMVTFQDGKEFMKMEITEVKFNTGLEDSFFKMKGANRPLPASILSIPNRGGKL